MPTPDPDDLDFQAEAVKAIQHSTQSGLPDGQKLLFLHEAQVWSLLALAEVLRYQNGSRTHF